MAQSNLIKTLLDGTAPRNLRMLVARGSAPLPAREMIELLVYLLKDADPEVSSSASKTIGAWDRDEILAYLRADDCSPSVMEYFADTDTTDVVLQTIVSNPAAPGKTIEALALSAQSKLLEKILDNRTRILEFPEILENIKKNPYASPEVRRLVQEIEVEFFGSKKKTYALEEAPEPPDAAKQILMESPVPLEDLSLEGLPLDGEERLSELTKRISCLSVREKIKYALFGNREIRAVLVRDTNKEVARSVLHSPKLTENEVEAIAAMRAVAEDILREIGNSRKWTRSTMVVQNLVRNPKTPPVISQRLLFRLHTRDLMQISRDRSIPDAVRYNATRTLNQRTRSTRSPK